MIQPCFYAENQTYLLLTLNISDSLSLLQIVWWCLTWQESCDGVEVCETGKIHSNTEGKKCIPEGVFVCLCVCLPPTLTQTFDETAPNTTEHNIPGLASIKGSWFCELENTHRYLRDQITTKPECHLILRIPDIWHIGLLAVECIHQCDCQIRRNLVQKLTCMTRKQNH